MTGEVSMKMKKIMSVAAAAALTASLMAVAPTASAEETYHAYIGVQSASFTFRNAWNEGTYGLGKTGDDGMVYFDQLTGWDGPTAVNKGGVFTDAEITGDGTYTVSVTDFDFGDDETLNLLFVSTDIPQASGATISDVKIVMDGQTKYTFDDAYLSPDEQEYLQPMAINIWNDDLGKEDGLFGYVMPSDSIEVTFTVSGLGGAAAEEAAAEEEAPAEEAAPAETEAVPAETEAAPAAAEETTPAATGNRSAMVVGSIMAVAAAAAVAIKKRK
jgi:hypothetical protein